LILENEEFLMGYAAAVIVIVGLVWLYRKNTKARVQISPEDRLKQDSDIIDWIIQFEKEVAEGKYESAATTFKIVKAAGATKFQLKDMEDTLKKATS
jgi:hypothetical protein